MNSVIKAILIATYALAISSLFVALPFGAGPVLRNISLVLLLIHVLELIFAFKHVRLYRGPLALSVLLTLLYGLFHWKPLADAQARQSAA